MLPSVPGWAIVATMTTKMKHPGGRPRDPRQVKVQIRLNGAEFAAWTKAAEEAGHEYIGTWARGVVNAALGVRTTV
jgi:hypothetical protein